MTFTKEIFTVSEILSLINEALATFEVTVEGEVSNYRVSQNKWASWELLDEKGVLSCFTMVFKVKTPLADGMKIRVFGRPRIYAPNGKFSFWVESIELTGEGALKRAFELTKQKLMVEGLFDVSRKRPLPRFPSKIGLITSRDAAAYTDFIKVLNGRLGGLEILHVNVQVQGAAAVPQIVNALAYLNKHHPDLDVIVLTRGGGSLEDLQAFNNEDVVRAIFASDIPTVCGVGHERDITLADLVTDVRASTPSNAAELITPSRAELKERLDRLIETMENILTNRLWSDKQKVTQILHHLQLAMNVGQKIDRVNETARRLLIAYQRLSAEKQAQINEYQRLLNSFNPLNVLKRGYAIVYQTNGHLINNIGQVTNDQRVKTKLNDGEFNAQVLNKKIYEQRKEEI